MGTARDRYGLSGHPRRRGKVHSGKKRRVGLSVPQGRDRLTKRTDQRCLWGKEYRPMNRRHRSPSNRGGRDLCGQSSGGVGTCPSVLHRDSDLVGPSVEQTCGQISSRRDVPRVKRTSCYGLDEHLIHGQIHVRNGGLPDRSQSSLWPRVAGSAPRNLLLHDSLRSGCFCTELPIFKGNRHATLRRSRLLVLSIPHLLRPSLSSLRCP